MKNGFGVMLDKKKVFEALKVRVVLELSEEGYVAYAPSLPDCASEGNTGKEALKNIKEAIESSLKLNEDNLSTSTDKTTIELVVLTRY